MSSQTQQEKQMMGKRKGRQQHRHHQRGKGNNTSQGDKAMSERSSLTERIVEHDGMAWGYDGRCGGDSQSTEAEMDYSGVNVNNGN